MKIGQADSLTGVCADSCLPVYQQLVHSCISHHRFFLRAFKFGKYSLLNLFSDQLIKAFSIPSKPIDQAPKRFAAKASLVFAIAILALQLTGHSVAAVLFAGVITLFSLLESFAGFCAGCYVYTFYLKFSRLIKPGVS